MRLFLFLAFTIGHALASTAGNLVPIGTPRPAAAFGIKPGGLVAFDLLLNAPLPVRNSCSWELYALGGPSALSLAKHRMQLDCRPDPEGGYRALVRLELPPARPGARFLLRVNSLEPSQQILGQAILVASDGTAEAQLRRDLARWALQTELRNPALRQLVESCRPAEVEDPAGHPRLRLVEVSGQPASLVEDNDNAAMEVLLEQGTQQSLIMTASPRSAGGLSVHVRLPKHHDWSNHANSVEVLTEVLRYVADLTEHSDPISP